MNTEIDIKILWLSCKKNYKLCLSIIFAFFSIGLTYVLLTSKVYVAETTVFIDPEQKNLVENVTSEKSSSEQLSKASIQSQISILSSRKVILQVIEKLMHDKELFKNEKLFQKMSKQNKNIIVQHIKNNLLILHSDDTYIINVRYQDGNPIIAAKVANFFAEAYIQEQIDAIKNNSVQSRLWLSEKIQRLKKQVSEANKDVRDFKVKYNFFSSSKDQNTETGATSAISVQLSQARAETALARARYEHSHNLINARNIDAALAEALDNNVINGIRGKYLERKQKYYELQRTLGNDHQVVKKIKSEIGEFESLIFAEMERLTRTQLSAYEIAKLQEKTLESKLNEILTIEKDNSTSQTQLSDLEQKAKTYQKILEDFIEKYENLEQKEDFSLTKTRIISEATPPEDHSHPKTFLILALMTILGSGISFIIVFYKALKDNTLKTAEDISRILGLKNLGYIPKQKSNHLNNEKIFSSKEQFILDIPSNLISEDHISPLVNESFRKVKYKIDAIENAKKNCKLIGVTSSKSNEGKTTVSTSLAQYISNLGHKTLLIDFDTYNPLFNNNNFSYEVPTLKDYFHNNVPFDINKVLRDTLSGLYIIPGILKKTKDHVSFNMKEVEVMFNYLSQNFEYIICDLPPLSVTADTEITIPHLDGFITVIEWSKTDADILKNNLTNVGLSGNNASKIIGTIINKIDPQRAKDFTYPYYDYAT